MKSFSRFNGKFYYFLWAGQGAWLIISFFVISPKILVLGIGTCNMKKIFDFFYILWYWFEKVQKSSIVQFIAEIQFP